MTGSNELCIGICAPSHPAHHWFSEKYQFAMEEMKRKGFCIIEGKLIQKGMIQGYRTADPKQRADEFMELIRNKNVDIIMPVKGGANSASLLPYLDYEAISKANKIICGNSDITALHMGILKKSKIPTLYGPTMVQSFGEYEGVNPYTLDMFQTMISGENHVVLYPPDVWSNQFLNAYTNEWKTKRTYIKNSGWHTFRPGHATGEVIVANINTLVSLIGTDYVPDFSDRILILEEANAQIDVEERNLNILKLCNVFQGLRGLIVSKPEQYNDLGSNIKYIDLLKEFIGEAEYPVVTNFDCGHTIPMLPIPQLSQLSLSVDRAGVSITILENSLRRFNERKKKL